MQAEQKTVVCLKIRGKSIAGGEVKKKPGWMKQHVYVCLSYK